MLASALRDILVPRLAPTQAHSVDLVAARLRATVENGDTAAADGSRSADRGRKVGGAWARERATLEELEQVAGTRASDWNALVLDDGHTLLAYLQEAGVVPDRHDGPLTLERDAFVDELVEGAAEVYEEVRPHLASSPRRLTYMRHARGARRSDDRSVARTPCTIAHDYRGVTNVMRGSADLARGKLEPNHPALTDIARIIRACEEAARPHDGASRDVVHERQRAAWLACGRRRAGGFENRVLARAGGDRDVDPVVTRARSTVHALSGQVWCQPPRARVSRACHEMQQPQLGSGFTDGSERTWQGGCHRDGHVTGM